MRRGRGRRGRRAGAAGRRSAAAALRHRRRGGVGRRAAVRRRDRRRGGALRAVSAQGEFTELARRGGRGALGTVLSGPGAGGKLLVTADGERVGFAGGQALEESAAPHADHLLWAAAPHGPQRGGEPPSGGPLLPAA